METHEFKTEAGLNNCIELIYFLYEEIDDNMDRQEFVQYLKNNRKDLKKYGITCNLRSKTLTTWYDEEEEE